MTAHPDAVLTIRPDLARRLQAIAATRGVEVEQLLAQWAEDAIEAQEDAEDIAALDAWRANPEPTIPLDQLLRELESV